MKKRLRLKILIVDASEGGFLGFSWKTGASVFSKSFDKVHYVKSVEEFYDVLSAYSVGSIEHLQVWGHGLPGAPYINGKPLKAGHDAWLSVKDGVVWFRACSVMAGSEGFTFSHRLSQQGLSVVGHLAIIGFWAMQSYTVGLRPGDVPWWPRDLKPKTSAPWLPRTIPAFWMDIPDWVFNKKEPKLK